MSNWRLSLLNIAHQVIYTHLRKLTKLTRSIALVIDDTLIDRSRSEKVELLARVKDHVSNTYKKGFRMLTIGWTDGASFIPLAFSLLSSTDKKQRLYEAGPEVPVNSPGYLRRQEAMRSATEVAIDLLGEIMKSIRCFKYVLFDSWFAWPSFIFAIKDKKRDVICMVKDMPTLFYGYNGKIYRLSDLYSVISKKNGSKEVLASVIVHLQGRRVRIVFVRNRNKGAQRKWLALLSTDLGLSEEEIIRIYGMRWDIEVFFKMCKSFLRLAKEFQVRIYDAMIAATSIVCIRYILLAYESRFNKDYRAFGGIFYHCCDEVAEITFQQAFAYIMDLLIKTLREVPFLSDEQIDYILEQLIENLPSILKKRLLANTA
ncbi:MAG: transposase [Candidatus Methanomethyliaceae archaeon]